MILKFTADSMNKILMRIRNHNLQDTVKGQTYLPPVRKSRCIFSHVLYSMRYKYTQNIFSLILTCDAKQNYWRIHKIFVFCCLICRYQNNMGRKGKELCTIVRNIILNAYKKTPRNTSKFERTLGIRRSTIPSIVGQKLKKQGGEERIYGQ